MTFWSTVSGIIAAMNKPEIFQTIAADAARGELAFPTSARVALKLRQALADPDCHVEAAAKLVQAEPLLAARVVAMANSVAYNRSGREFTDVRTSVSRLGFSTLRSLAMALVTRQLAGQPATPVLQQMTAQLWQHTAHVASLAHLIAQRVTKVDPETAMFAGILHEVGGFYLLSRAAEFPALLDGDCADWIESGEAQVGRAVLKVLAVPEEVAGAIEAYWDGYLTIPSASLGDTLLLADELAPVASPLHALAGATAGDEAAPGRLAASIDMVIGEETLAGILADSAEQVESLARALTF